MKFWFGKKDAGSGEEASGVTDDAQKAPSLFPDADGAPVWKEEEEEKPVDVSAPRVPDPEVKKDAEGAVGGIAVVQTPAPAVPAPAVSAAKGPAAKVVLKAVGGPVKVTARPAAGTVGAEVSQTSGKETGGGGRPQLFGLRPKVAAAPEAPAAVVVAEEKTPAERDTDEIVVRPRSGQRALYYQLMNGLYDALLILDDQGHVVDCSTRVEEVLGYSREDAWDLPIGKIITGMSSQMFGHLKRNLAENHHILIDARCFRKDGSSFSGEVGVSTLSLTRGDNMVFAIRNVERRKSAIEDLRKSRAALEVALVSAFVCDPDGFFLMVNPALLEAFGIPDEAQAKSVRFMDLLPDASRFFLRAACGEKLREKMQIPTPEGTLIKIEVALVPVQTGQNITAVAGSILQL